MMAGKKRLQRIGIERTEHPHTLPILICATDYMSLWPGLGLRRIMGQQT
jgi:hypothetical protein